MAGASVTEDRPQPRTAWDRFALGARVGGVVVLGIIGLAACGGEKTATTDPVQASPTAGATVAATQAVTPGSVVDAITVTSENVVQAMRQADFRCTPVDTGFTCVGDGGEIEVGVPHDWNADARLRQRACDEGYINTDYQVVGDGTTWYAAIDSHEEGVAIINVLAAAGYVTGFFDYCPSR
jgi:hypothetical protein